MSLVFVANRTTAKTRRETVAGTEYLVVPVVALVAGVVNSEYVPVNEIIPEDWNGVPVPLGHPQANGEYISARSPELEAQAPARFYHARLENNSLKGEIWINLAQAQAIGGEAAEAVKRFEAGQMVNVSTGYFRDLEPTSGTYGSKAYQGIARNLRPDQLAILLNENGACNIDDGCGAPRTNALRVNMDFSDSVIIAFYPSAADAQALALTGADLPKGSEVTPPSQLHVTLCHLGQIDEMTQGEDVALRELANFASRMPIVHATVGGVGQFNNDDPQGLFAIIDSTYLQDWRRSLVYWVEDYFSIRRDYGFTSHCTLAYVPAGQPVTLPMLERREIVFDSVALSWGNRTTVFRLQGELREVTDDYEMTGNAKRPSAWETLGRIAKNFLGINLKSNEMEVAVKEKEKLIAALVANARCKFKEEELKKLDEGQLKTLSDSLAEPTSDAAPPPATIPAPEPTPVPVPTAPSTSSGGSSGHGTGQADPVAALTQMVSELTKTVQELTGKIQTNADQERTELVANLVASQTIYTAEELNKLDTPILQKMRLQFTPADYSLRGLPVANTAGGDWVEYEIVTPSQNGGTN